MHIMKLLEKLPDLEDDFEMMLSRKVSFNTELEDLDNISEEHENQMLDEKPSKVSIYSNILLIF